MTKLVGPYNLPNSITIEEVEFEVEITPEQEEDEKSEDN